MEDSGLNKLHSDRILSKIRESVYESITHNLSKDLGTNLSSFYDKPMSKEIKVLILNTIDKYVEDILKGYKFYKNYIGYDVEFLSSENKLQINPYNLFTTFLMRGYFMPEVINKNVYEDENGKWEFNEGEVYFYPNKLVKYIQNKISFNGHNLVR